MSPAYGDRPPWHDVQLEVRGPAVGMLDAVFRERWEDPQPLDLRTPIARIRDAAEGADLRADPLPAAAAGPRSARVGDRAGAAHLPRRSGPGTRSRRAASARSPAATPRRSDGRARLIYLQDQYMWSPHIARLLAKALLPQPRSCTWWSSCRGTRTSTAGSPCRPTSRAPAGARRSADGRPTDRVHVFDLENHEGTPVYVHAKVAVVDDVWAACGSANLNRRSWSHDSELTVAVLDDERDPRAPADPAGRGDGARVFARDLRLRLLREHLDRGRRRQRPRGPDRGGADGRGRRRRPSTTGTRAAGSGPGRRDGFATTGPSGCRGYAAVGRARLPARLRPRWTIRP